MNPFDKANSMFMYDRNVFAKMMGSALDAIKRAALKGITEGRVCTRGNGVYYVDIQLNDLDVSSVEKHREFMSYFQNHTAYCETNGIPLDIIALDIADHLAHNGVQGITDLQVKTTNLSDMYNMRIADVCCTCEGIAASLLCCCLPVLCASCKSKTFKVGKINATMRLTFRTECI